MSKFKHVAKIIREVLAENSTTGGGCAGASFTPGAGEQYASPKAFGKNKSKTIIRKDLWKENIDADKDKLYNRVLQIIDNNIKDDSQGFNIKDVEKQFGDVIIYALEDKKSPKFIAHSILKYMNITPKKVTDYE